MFSPQMKFVFRILIPFAILSVLGCSSASKRRHVLVSVVDETGRPLAGIWVSTHDQEGKLMSRTPASSDVITGPDGLAMLVVKDIFASYHIHTKDSTNGYRWASMVALSPNGRVVVHKRPSDDLPTTPDVVAIVLSDEELAKRREISRREQENREKATREAVQRELEDIKKQVRRLFEQSPDFWPETKPNLPWVKDATGLMLLELRWNSASKESLGNQSDVEAIRRAVIDQIKPQNGSVQEIRWLTSSRVMVVASWYRSSLAAAGYTFVLDKRDGQWAILARYLNWVS